MKTFRNTVRVVFLVLVMLTYAKNSYAGPNWNIYCSGGCNGAGWRVNNCQFIDYSDYPYGVADESWCGWDYYGDPYQEGLGFAYWVCYGMSGGQAPPYSSFYASCTEEPTQGSFYCSYFDPTCGS